MRIEVDDSLPDGCVEYLEVNFQAQRGGAMKALGIIANEQPAHCQSIVRRAPDNGKHIDNGQMSQEAIGRVIENVAHGILSTAHDAFHPINRAQIMAPVYRVAASRANQNVLVVISHTDNLVRDDLADGENEIEVALCDEPVHLRRPCIVQLAFRLLVDEFRRNLAQSFDVGSPVMHAEKLLRHGAEHSSDLFRLHGRMGAKSGQNRLQPVAVIHPRVARQVAGAGVHAALVGRYNEHAASLSKLHQTFHKQAVQLRKEIAFDTAHCTVETHAANSTFLNPGASMY